MPSDDDNSIDIDGVDDVSIDMDDFGDAINNSRSRDTAFWEAMRDESRLAFDTSLEQIKENQDRAIELIKIDLLIGSFFAGLLNFSNKSVQYSLTNFYVLIPIILLAGSILILLITYFTRYPHIVGPSSANAHNAIKENHSKKRFLITLSCVYFSWSDSNHETHKKGITLITASMVLKAAALGGVLAFVTAP